jgi:hypothetical protein
MYKTCQVFYGSNISLDSAPLVPVRRQINLFKAFLACSFELYFSNIPPRTYRPPKQWLSFYNSRKKSCFNFWRLIKSDSFHHPFLSFILIFIEVCRLLSFCCSVFYSSENNHYLITLVSGNSIFSPSQTESHKGRKCTFSVRRVLETTDTVEKQ